MGRDIEKVVVVTRRTRLQLLEERYATREQARFVLTRGAELRAGTADGSGRDPSRDFEDLEAEHATYQEAVERVLGQMDPALKVQVLDRALVPTFLFTERDAIVALGQDGLVANVAKYTGAQPIIGVNPDPARIDGVLLPFHAGEVGTVLAAVRRRTARVREVTLAEAVLDDGQRMRAFNELFIGASTHVSARYRIRHHGYGEAQSSSGVLVCTGAGSTGWLSSVYTMAGAITGTEAPRGVHPWEDQGLTFVVREPFVSKTSGAQVVFGRVMPGEALVVESMMAGEGVIFSDGIEKDFCAFPSGRVATVAAAPERARLVVR
ncbi:MAG: NAD+ kinase [Candidatus Sumerlaeia bacterium]|nr:NAD+ kinase [Candidatus Sumerlaeia bacterium]